MKPFYKIAKFDGSVIATYDNLSTAAKESDSGLTYQAISLALKNQRLSTGLYFYRFADEYNGFESFEGKKHRPIFIKDIKTNQISWFESIIALSKVLFIPDWSIRTALSKYDGRMSRLGYEAWMQKDTNEVIRLCNAGYEVVMIDDL